MNIRTTALALLLAALPVACSSTSSTPEGDAGPSDTGGASTPIDAATPDSTPTNYPPPRFTKFEVETLAIPYVALCVDHFDLKDNAGYATGPEGQVKNVTNRFEWAKPLMSRELYEVIQYSFRSSDGAVI